VSASRLRVKRTHDNTTLQICCPHRNSNWPNSEHNSEACCLNVLSILSEIWRSHSGVADGWKLRDVVPDVSEDHNAFRFSVKRSDLIWRWKHFAFGTLGTTRLKKLRHFRKAWVFTLFCCDIERGRSCDSSVGVPNGVDDAGFESQENQNTYIFSLCQKVHTGYKGPKSESTRLISRE
jgi:hypothetical protein